MGSGADQLNDGLARGGVPVESDLVAAARMRSEGVDGAQLASAEGLRLQGYRGYGSVRAHLHAVVGDRESQPCEELGHQVAVYPPLTRHLLPDE